MRIAITGSTGMIGSQLLPVLTRAGHTAVRLVRRDPAGSDIRWDSAGAGVPPGALRGVDAVIHLAGENIGEGRWTESRKRQLLESRKVGTRLIAEAVARDQVPVLVSASAIGFYGERGDETLTESSPPGSGFLPDVCLAWEGATEPASKAGARVAIVRTGLVLSTAGGVLQRMLTPFKLGVGGRLGSGQQWMSWISLADLLSAYQFVTEGTLHGPVNAVAPGAVRNREFAEALGHALHRPTLLPVPRFGLELLFGQMADEAILASTHVLPTALEQAGFPFRHPRLVDALAHELGKVA